MIDERGNGNFGYGRAPRGLYGREKERDRRFTFNISESEWHKLMKIADKMHCSNAQAARYCIEMAFDEVCKGRIE